MVTPSTANRRAVPTRASRNPPSLEQERTSFCSLSKPLYLSAILCCNRGTLPDIVPQTSVYTVGNLPQGDRNRFAMAKEAWKVYDSLCAPIISSTRFRLLYNVGDWERGGRRAKGEGRGLPRSGSESCTAGPRHAQSLRPTSCDAL